MGYSLELTDIPGLASVKGSQVTDLNWPLFVTPAWLGSWWPVFGGGFKPFLAVVRKNESVIGIAPLKLEGRTASFMGNPDVADYQDFIIKSDSEKEFFGFLLDDLGKNGVNRLDLGHLRPDSVTLKHLRLLAEERGLGISCKKEDVSFEFTLPSSFENYLEMLEGKQRHEVKRQLRRLAGAGEVKYVAATSPGDVAAAMDRFIEMMRESRQDKARFMDATMEGFFKRLAENMAEAGMARLGQLKLDGLVVAAVFCFDYNETMYLYNSGYDPEYAGLGVGLLSKVFCIKDGIELGRRVFDFLKGGEVYKGRMGGEEVTLQRCTLDL
jgi:CelD/BcsL family acetyltransferase involved in cellulose biosynthesis